MRGAGALLLLAACAHRVGPEQAKKLIEDGAKLVDVRSPDEFGSGHLDGAINIPVSELEERLADVGPKDQPVVVYCASGFRSARAARILDEKGFTHVADLGAMSNWTATAK
jgi:phage shock protein E